ncbi:hypothetical protein F511_45591 [Dorcoceras hygrometricum]|uniref:Uncharacterized protein n=1 Tax=Dorcoceras hygrometricum TaxID=472368 RepID=A0A2Z6ZVJ1_9LAMI|nr:hypothetical protein F511_45591 [Dorcoceras hygrometricum]
MGDGAPPDSMAACARAASHIARDFITCWSRDGRLLDVHWLRDSGTLARRWSSAVCARVGRRRALLAAQEVRAGRASRPSKSHDGRRLAAWLLHAGRPLSSDVAPGRVDMHWLHAASCGAAASFYVVVAPPPAASPAMS